MFAFMSASSEVNCFASGLLTRWSAGTGHKPSNTERMPPIIEYPDASSMAKQRPGDDLCLQDLADAAESGADKAPGAAIGRSRL